MNGDNPRRMGYYKRTGVVFGCAFKEMRTIMNSQGITRTIVFAICTALSFVASAVDSEKALPEVKATAVPVAPEATADDGASQAAWEQKETELLKVLKEVVVAQTEAQKGDAAIDWSAVETGVKGRIFRKASADGDGAWPNAQMSWVRAARNELRRDEKRGETDMTGDAELAALVALEAKLNDLAHPESNAEGAKAGEGGNAADDETLWKFRDKSGSRTTKPRYKGQEPVN